MQLRVQAHAAGCSARAPQRRNSRQPRAFSVAAGLSPAAQQRQQHQRQQQQVRIAAALETSPTSMQQQRSSGLASTAAGSGAAAAAAARMVHISSSATARKPVGLGSATVSLVLCSALGCSKQLVGCGVCCWVESVQSLHPSPSPNPQPPNRPTDRMRRTRTRPSSHTCATRQQSPWQQPTATAAARQRRARRPSASPPRSQAAG